MNYLHWDSGFKTLHVLQVRNCGKIDHIKNMTLDENSTLFVEINTIYRYMKYQGSQPNVHFLYFLKRGSTSVRTQKFWLLEQ